MVNVNVNSNSVNKNLVSTPEPNFQPASGGPGVYVPPPKPSESKAPPPRRSGSGGGGGGSSSSFSSSQNKSTSEPNISLATGGTAYVPPPSNIVSNIPEQKKTTQSSIKKIETIQPTTTIKKQTEPVKDSFINRFLGRGQFEDTSTAGTPKALKKTPFTKITFEQRKKELKTAAGGALLAATLISPIPGDEIIAGAALTGRAATAAKIGLTTARFGVKGARTIVGGLAGVEGAKETSRITAPKAQREIIQSSSFSNILGTSIAKESQAIKQKGIAKSIAGEIPGLRLFSAVGDEKAFREEATKQFIAQGLKGDQLNIAVAAAERQRKAAYTGEIFGTLTANVGSELIGRDLLSGAFSKTTTIPAKQAASKLFGKSFLRIGSAGIVEGVAGELTTEQARGEKINPGKIALAGVIGFVSAGLIGGSIAATRLNKPITSKTIETVANIVDPFEKPGDVLASGVQKIIRTPVVTPVILDTRTTDTITFTTEQKAKQVKKKTKSSSLPMVDVGPLSLSFTQVESRKGSQVPVSPQIITTNVGTQIPVNPFQETLIIPTEPQVPIPVNPLEKTFIPTQPQVPVNVPANVPLAIPGFTNIPTVVPFPRVPPPLPLSFPVGSGRSGGFGFGQGFVNELAIGGTLLKDLNKSNENSLGSLLFGNVPRKTSSNKKSSKRSLTPFDIIFGL